MSSYALPCPLRQPIWPPVTTPQTAIRWLTTWIPACPGVTGGETRCRSVRIRISRMSRCTGWIALDPVHPVYPDA